MRRWRTSRWPLRTRVALAFLAATTVAVALLGVLVQVRVADALEERLRDAVSAEGERLEVMTVAERAAAVGSLGGEVQAQVLSGEGEVLATSRLLVDPVLASTATYGWIDRTVTVLDDDAATTGEEDPERERFALEVVPVDEGVLVVGTSREDTDEALDALHTQLLVLGPLALALVGALGYVVAGAGLRPIERLRARAATISARTAGERLPVPDADDELRRLALTLNAMIGRLDDALQRERRFVAEASHDLRTPLALMLTEVELALQQPRTTEELKEALESIHDEVRRLVALAESLLEGAAGHEPSLVIEATPVDLAALAARVADRFGALAGERAIRVTGSREVVVDGDASRLDRALSNLVDNALRHGQGDVGIEVRVEGDTAEVVVTDGGAGFTPQAAAQPGRDRFGLAIATEIARAHGGTVETGHSAGRTRVRLTLASSYAGHERGRPRPTS